MTDPLDDLIVDESVEPDLTLISKILKGNVELTKKEGRIIFSEDFHDFPDWKKIMIFLLARKAVVIKKLNKEIKEHSMPTEIGKNILVSGDNVGKRLARELKGIAIKNPDGYFIPNYKLVKCRDLLESKK